MRGKELGQTGRDAADGAFCARHKEAHWSNVMYVGELLNLLSGFSCRGGESLVSVWTVRQKSNSAGSTCEYLSEVKQRWCSVRRKKGSTPPKNPRMKEGAEWHTNHTDRCSQAPHGSAKKSKSVGPPRQDRSRARVVGPRSGRGATEYAAGLEGVERREGPGPTWLWTLSLCCRKFGGNS